MARVDDRDRGRDVEVLLERADDPEGEVLLQHEAVRERVCELRDPREPRHAPPRRQRDVHLAVRRHQVVRTDEHQRDPRRDERPVVDDRESPAERCARRRVIARQQHLRERARDGARRRRELGIVDVDAERGQQLAHRGLGPRQIRRPRRRARLGSRRLGSRRLHGARPRAALRRPPSSRHRPASPISVPGSRVKRRARPRRNTVHLRGAGRPARDAERCTPRPPTAGPSGPRGQASARPCW